MPEKKLIDKFGPCGLLCEKCFAYIYSPIRFHANKLKENLGDFDDYAKRFSSLFDQPLFDKYPDFKKLLNYFSSINCRGCRKQTCHLFKDCNVKKCYKNKQIKYCYQCTDFPCNNTGFDENLRKRWLMINTKIRDIGLKRYYNEIRNKSRYISLQKTEKAK